MLVHSGTAAIDLRPAARPDPESPTIVARSSVEVPNIAGLDHTANAMKLRPSGLYAPEIPIDFSTLYGQTFNSFNYGVYGNPFSTASVAFRSFTVGPGTQPVSLYGTPLLAPAPLPSEQRQMPVIGFRGWGFSSKFRLGEGRNVALKSTGVDYHWKAGDNHATCTAGSGHQAADQNCSCGFYVLANLDELESHVSINDSTIVGAVMGWGKVIQHGTEGWRAEYAKIVGLVDCKYSKGQLRNTQQAAAAYDVEIYSRSAIEAYLKEWGDPFQA